MAGAGVLGGAERRGMEGARLGAEREEEGARDEGPRGERG